MISGVPIYCVILTASMSLLTYMNVSVSGSKVFLWVSGYDLNAGSTLTDFQFANLITTACLWAWMSICIAFIRFRKAQIAQGITETDLGFRSPFQPYLAWSTLVFFTIILIFNGFEVFLKGNWNINDFLVAYIGIP